MKIDRSKYPADWNEMGNRNKLYWDWRDCVLHQHEDASTPTARIETPFAFLSYNGESWDVESLAWGEVDWTNHPPNLAWSSHATVHGPTWWKIPLEFALAVFGVDPRPYGCPACGGPGPRIYNDWPANAPRVEVEITRAWLNDCAQAVARMQDSNQRQMAQGLLVFLDDLEQLTCGSRPGLRQ